ncbi:MAG: DUF3999 domain-containing protein [Acidobacteria bacterium]|nr:DUF3999 domain-containing protein [Acidobacteriota bacterium]
MKFAASCFLFAVITSAIVSQPAIPYFTHVREVEVAGPSHQNFLVIDEQVWSAARSDLGDLRLYAADGTEVPHALHVERSVAQQMDTEVRVLQPGTIGARTQFVLDVSGVEEYNRVSLRHDARDFVARATVEGQDDLHAARWVKLADVTLYDFTKERLGSNSTLHLPDSRFRYLRVTIAGGVPPANVKGAAVARYEEKPGRWTKVREVTGFHEDGKTTVISVDWPKNVPLERLTFDVDPSQVNFRREFQVINAENRRVAGGSLSRVRIRRAGSQVDSEDLALNLSGVRSKQFRIVIQNGDDPPSRLRRVEALSVERRLYFDPRGNTKLSLYYGDEKLSPPVYDYAKFFQADAAAPAARLASHARNSAYTGRPDTRPWSERNPAILWTALILAVAGLAAVALKGLRA